MRRARKVDTNQGEIVQALRDFDVVVEVLSDVGRGVPDLLASRGGRTFLLEVKAPDGKLTVDQLEWHRRWKGEPVAVVHSVREALNAVGILY